MYNGHSTNLILEINGTRIADISNALTWKLRRRERGNQTNVFVRGIIDCSLNLFSKYNRETYGSTVLIKCTHSLQYGCIRCIIFQEYQERKSLGTKKETKRVIIERTERTRGKPLNLNCTRKYMIDTLL